MKNIILIDGNNIFHRFKRLSDNAEQIVSIFLSNFETLINNQGANRDICKVVFLFDKGRPALRKETSNGEYKGNRTQSIEERDILIDFQEVLEKKITEEGFLNWIFPLEYSVMTYSNPELEADDIVANVCLLNELSDDPWNILIMSTDQDLYTYLSDNVSIIKDTVGKKVFTKKDFLESPKLGGASVSPNQWIFFKALVGDKSDNISGIPGIGSVSATKIIKEHNTLKDIMEYIKDRFESDDIIKGFKRDYLLVSPILDFDTVLEGLPDLIECWESDLTSEEIELEVARKQLLVRA